MQSCSSYRSPWCLLWLDEVTDWQKRFAMLQSIWRPLVAISEVTTFLINKFVHNNINEELVWKANLILELICLKDRSFSLSGSLFNCVDFDCMIEHLCTGQMPHCIFQIAYFRFHGALGAGHCKNYHSSFSQFYYLFLFRLLHELYHYFIVDWLSVCVTVCTNKR